MAAALDPGEVFRSTSGKANFQRLARLLISGGTTLLREVFDLICPPSNLPTILQNPATEKQLKAVKLTKPQWDCLYPSPGVYGKSSEFDVTLLFRLLRTICNLIPPATGWDALPTSTDHSLTADLTRIKYYHNSVYGHVNQSMEIADEEFTQLWQEIRDALVGIAGQVSSAKKTEWQEAIDNFLQDPLTAEDERNVEELLRWYRSNMEVKEVIKELKDTSHEWIERLDAQQKNTTQKVQEVLARLKTSLKSIDATQDIKEMEDMLHQLLKLVGEGSQSPEAVCSESNAQLTSLPSPKNQTISFVTSTDWSKLPKHIHPDSEDVYPMLKRPLGITLIINNESFHPNIEEMEELAVREGSERDVKALETLFEALSFKVKTERNKGREKILEILDHISHDVDHSSYDCFVLWLLSHGKDGHIYGADGETVPIESVRDFFSNARCPTLKGKPKLIFIQACRGSQKQKGVEADSPYSVSDQPKTNAKDDKITIADHADILMAYSTVSGYLSYRSGCDGSRFVQCIVEVFRKFAGHEDLLSMLIKVNKKISEMGNKDSKQVSAPTTTLTRKLYFWPGL